MATLAEITYDLALRALAQQEALLDELRARTGTLLTASSLLASFLGTEALRREGLSGAVVAALVAFGASIVLSAYVLLPRRGPTFAVDGRTVDQALSDVRDDADEVHLRLTYWLQALLDANESVVGRLENAFRAAVGALLADLAFLAVALGVH